MKVIRAYKPWSNGISSWRFVHTCGRHYQRRWRNGRRIGLTYTPTTNPLLVILSTSSLVYK